MTATNTTTTTTATTLWCLPDDVTRLIAEYAHAPTNPHLVLSMVVDRLESVLKKLDQDLTGMSDYDVNLVRNMWSNQFTLNLRGIVDKMIEDDRYIQQTSDYIVYTFGTCYIIDFEIDGFVMRPVIGCKYNTKYELIDGWWYHEDELDEDGEVNYDSADDE